MSRVSTEYRKKAAIVQEKVTVPMYFEQIVKPNVGSYYDTDEGLFLYNSYEKCPIHGEKTPSLKYFEDTNTFFCYACGAGGGILQLHLAFMKSLNGNDIDADEAVEFLYKFFIKNDVTVEQANIQLGNKDNQLETNSEALRKRSYNALKLSRRFREIENTLNNEYTNLSQEDKNSWFLVEQSIKKFASCGLWTYEKALEVMEKEFMNFKKLHNCSSNMKKYIV